jgi:hypothetical protein
MTVKHLRNLQKQKLTVASNQDPNVMNKYKLGYNECVQECLRFINNSANMAQMEPATRQRIISNLMRQYQNINSNSNVATNAQQTNAGNQALAFLMGQQANHQQLQFENFIKEHHQQQQQQQQKLKYSLPYSFLKNIENSNQLSNLSSSPSSSSCSSTPDNNNNNENEMNANFRRSSVSPISALSSCSSSISSSSSSSSSSTNNPNDLSNIAENSQHSDTFEGNNVWRPW